MGNSATPGGSGEPVAIRELFPPGDVIAEWVYSLSVLCDDLTVIAEGQKRALGGQHIRETLFYARQLFTRIYEAGRLVETMDTHPEIERFALGRGMEPPWWERLLLDVYRRQDGEKLSRVEQTYGRFRHQTVHLMWPGSSELADALNRAGWLPARIWVGDENRVVNQWVQAVSGMLLFGDTADPNWMQHFTDMNNLAGQISSAWLMLFATTLVFYARDRNIDLERLRVAEE